MDTAILIPVLLWLGVVSWFDIREHEIPHSAWVIIPLVLAIIYRVYWEIGHWCCSLS
jgi:hypothetical protein